MKSSLREFKQIREDIEEFISFAAREYQKVVQDEIISLSLDQEFSTKLGASYQIVGINFTERLWNRMIERVPEDIIYKRYIQMKKEHEDMFKRKLPDAWYKRAMTIVITENEHLNKKLRKTHLKIF